MKERFLLLAGILVFFLLQACQSKTEEKKETQTLPVTTPLVTDTTFVKEYVAEIQSVQNIELRARIKGFLEAIHIDEGQFVHAGQLLFTIRSKEVEAELTAAKAKVRTTDLELQNVRLLADKNIVSATELGLSIAKLNEAKAEQTLAETNLSFTKVYAPFTGIVDRLRFKAGSLVDEGTLLTSLSDNRNIFAYFNQSEREYLEYKARTDKDKKRFVTLILANNQPHKYPGLIETIEGEFDRNTGSIPFRAKFPNPEFLLKHGETGKIQLTIDLKNAMIIPQKATFEIQDRVYVYVVDDQNRVRAKNISIAQKLPNLYVVDSGISVTDRILLEGIQTVKEDDTITPVPQTNREVIEKLQLIK